MLGRYERANKTSGIIPHGAMTVLWGQNKRSCKTAEEDDDFRGKVIGSQPKWGWEQQRLFSSGRVVDAPQEGVGNSAVKRGALTGRRPTE